MAMITSSVDAGSAAGTLQDGHCAGRLSVAIVGAGIGAEHMRAYLTLPDLYRVAAICDLDAARAAPLVEASAAEYVASLDALLRRADIDVIDICLPPSLHRQAILDALAHGKHVVCEKPLVKSLAEADEVMAAASRADRHVIPIFQYRFGRGLGQLCHLIDQGLAGKPLVATVETHWRRDADYYSVPWRGRWATELGGALVGHAIHAHDLLVRVLGPIAAVQASIATRVNDIEVEDCAAIVFTLASGALATSSVTLGSADDRSRLLFCFAGLSAESGLSPYNPAAEPWQFMARETSQESIDAALAQYPAHRDGFGREFELAHATLTAGAATPVSLIDARQSLEVITAIYASDRSGERVQLPLTADFHGYASWVPA